MMNFTYKTLFIVLIVFSNAFSQNDCQNALVICGNNTFSGLSVQGAGIQELNSTNNRCDGTETNSLWLKINVKTSGTLGFNLIPSNPNISVDFDFFIFGPNVNCNNLGMALRCSTTNPQNANLNNNYTGLNGQENDTFEGPGASGNSYISWMNVLANQSYYIVIDRPGGNSDFSLEWTGTATLHQEPIIYTNPLANNTLNLNNCKADNNTNPVNLFDLNQNTPIAIGNQSDITATYHHNFNDAFTNVNPINTNVPFQINASSQTLYIRLTNNISKCFDTLAFNLNIINFQTNNPINLYECDKNNNGIATFNLTQNDTVLTNNDPNIQVSYHPAPNDTITLPNNYSNQVAYANETVWVKMVNTLTGCFTFKAFELIINRNPTIYKNPLVSNTLNLEKCDNNDLDNFTNFDLTLNTSIAVGNQTNITTSYHTSLIDANQNNYPINNPENYTNLSNPQTIYIRLTNNETGCFSTSSFNISIIPILFNNPSNLYGCDNDNNGFVSYNLAENDPIIANNQSNLVISYHPTNNDLITLPANYTNQNAFTNETIWAKILNSLTGCYTYKSFEIISNNNPIIHTNPLQGNTLNIEKCDDNVPDNVTNFNLNLNTPIAIGNQTNVNVSYHLSMANAQTGTNAITATNNFLNTSNPQTVYIRLTNSLTGCFSTSQFNLIIKNFNTNEPNDLIECDIDNDGYATFDLSENNTILINNNSNYIVTYHLTPNNPNALPNLFTNRVPYSNETIWAKILNSNTGCYVFKSFAIIVNTIPLILTNPQEGNTLNLKSCDKDLIADGLTSFNLNINANIAINNQTNVSANFYTNFNDALFGTNVIPNPENYTNNSNPQRLFIKLTQDQTGCFSILPFDISVLPFVSNDPIDLEECMINNRGFATFNLTRNDAVLIAGRPGISVRYYASPNDVMPLPTNYTNRVAFRNETVWAKINNDNTGCYLFKPFELRLKQGPPVFPATLAKCDVQLNPDGLANFTLSDANNTITGNNNNLSTQFYLDLTQAQNQTNLLNNSFTNTTNPQTLAVRVTDNLTGCVSFTTLTLKVNFTATRSLELQNCDNDGIQDGFYNFNLLDIGLENAANTVNYYANLNDALAAANALSNTYTNQEEYFQTIYATIESPSECKSIHTIQLIVNELPFVEVTSLGLLCLNDPTKPVILTANVNNGATTGFSYLWTPGNFSTESIQAYQPGVYSVKVKNNQTGCEMTESIEVNASETAIFKEHIIVDLTNNNTITVMVSGISTGYLYSLDEEYGPFQESNYFTNVKPGKHIVYVKDVNGCGIVEDEVNILGVPKFFTPNGDGIHDTWNVQGISNTFNAYSIVYIFDRYGKLLKQIDPLGQGWDGTYNGVNMPSDDYWYAIEFEDGRSTKGNFSLKR